jgi:hypothetical protein
VRGAALGMLFAADQTTSRSGSLKPSEGRQGRPRGSSICRVRSRESFGIAILASFVATHNRDPSRGSDRRRECRQSDRSGTPGRAHANLVSHGYPETSAHQAALQLLNGQVTHRPPCYSYNDRGACSCSRFLIAAPAILLLQHQGRARSWRAPHRTRTERRARHLLRSGSCPDIQSSTVFLAVSTSTGAAASRLIARSGISFRNLGMFFDQSSRWSSARGSLAFAVDRLNDARAASENLPCPQQATPRFL